MTFLPIVDRELRVQARQKRTFQLRLVNAAAAMALMTYLLWLNDGLVTRGSPPHRVFTVMAWLGFLYCLLGGAANTADSLSEEKREGTMGLLFLTDLKGYDVVLGKMLATSLKNLYALIAIFPPIGILLCLGGVTAGEFWRLVLLLICTLFFSLTVGMFVSALSREEQGAWAGTAGLLALLAAAPAYAFRSVFAAGYGFNPGAYWNGLLAVQVLSCLLLAGASLVLPRAWQETGRLPRRRPFSGWFPFSRLALPGGRRGGGREALFMSNPVQWFAWQQSGLGRSCLWSAVLLAAAVGVGAVVLGPRIAVLGVLCGGALALHFLIAIWVAFQASSLFAEARRSGALELLLATPLTANQIIDGYYLGLRRSLGRPILVLLVVEGIILLGEVAALGVQGNQNPVGLFLFLLLGSSVGILLFVTDLLAAGSFGLWMGLTSKKPAHAFMSTVLYVLVLPLFGTLLMPPIWWFKNAFFRKYAQERLRQHFRVIVTEGLPERRRPGLLPPVLEP